MSSLCRSRSRPSRFTQSEFSAKMFFPPPPPENLTYIKTSKFLSDWLHGLKSEEKHSVKPAMNCAAFLNCGIFLLCENYGGRVETNHSPFALICLSIYLKWRSPRQHRFHAFCDKDQSTEPGGVQRSFQLIIEKTIYESAIKITNMVMIIVLQASFKPVKHEKFALVVGTMSQCGSMWQRIL